MPCHEHGVGLDGFQVERTDEDAFADGSAAERRERSACPSGDREATRFVLVVVNINIIKKKQNKREWTSFSIWDIMRLRNLGLIELVILVMVTVMVEEMVKVHFSDNMHVGRGFCGVQVVGCLSFTL